MKRYALSLFFRWVCSGVVFLFAVGSLSAQVGTSVSASYGPVSGSCSISYNATAGQVTFTGTKSADSGGNSLTIYYQTASAEGVYSGTLGSFNAGGAAGSNSSPYSAAPGQWFRMWLYFSGPAEGAGSHAYEMYFQAGTTANYKVTFAIPANNTDRVIRYEVWQSGSYTGFSATQGPGDPAREFTAEPLNSAASATLREVRANFEQGADGMWYQGTSDLVRVVNGGTTPVVTGGTATPGSVAGPTQAVSGQPAAPAANVTTKAPDVAAPTAAPTVTVPGSLPAPNATPTGTGGATKADIEKAANDIAAAVSATNQQGTTNANAIITAINANAVAGKDQANAIIKAANSTSTAVDNAAKQTTDGLAAVGSKIDATNSKLDTVNTRLETSNTNTAATVAKLTDISAKLGPTATDAATAAATAVASATTAGTAAGSAAAGWFSANTPPSAVPTLTTETGILAVTMPEEFGGKTFDMNPFSSDRFQGVISWFRAATAWAALVGLGVWVWLQTKGWLAMFSGVQQAKGNTVAGTGGQATAFVAAGLMTAAIVTGVTGLLGWAFGDISFPAIRAAAMVNPLTSMPAKAAWMLDQVFPVATLVSCLLARLSFNMYAAPLFATCQAIVRFIVP